MVIYNAWNNKYKVKQYSCVDGAVFIYFVTQWDDKPKNMLQPRLGCHYFLAHFYKIHL
jgi:hypothetical protein